MDWSEDATAVFADIDAEGNGSHDQFPTLQLQDPALQLQATALQAAGERQTRIENEIAKIDQVNM